MGFCTLLTVERARLGKAEAPPQGLAEGASTCRLQDCYQAARPSALKLPVV